MFAAWTPHIPEVKDRLGLNDGTLGLALLGAPVGSVIAMLAAGAPSPGGAASAGAADLPAYALVSPALGFAPSPVWLFVALAFWGGFQGALDVR